MWHLLEIPKPFNSGCCWRLFDPCTGVCLEQRPSPEVLPCNPQEQWIICSSCCGVRHWELQLVLLQAGLWLCAWPWWDQCLGWLLLQAGDYLQFWARSFINVTSPVPEVPGGYAKFACNCTGVSSWLSHSTQTSVPPHSPGSLSSPRHLELPEGLHMNLSLIT